ncbi:LysR family transcriptional regulator [Streptomyces actinomycinicus]|uniref:LysR family transcriptional regulator n=1 Tax=Streptomyces actinomycinicus TaxID=1695166 RepID=A0A937JMM6_9ACTN|nr:LysR family transcriptional regulator [Streptomyces actinomycinicus]MBL1083665.1 LysR family transcriptional regulator [Streptomyces actinomycinicus]
MLDVRRLVLLRDLAAHETVTAVAELHGVTPSAVSQQLRLLEEETRTRLLERTGRSIRLTPAGHRLAEDTEQVLDALDRAQRHLRSQAAEPVGPLHLACFPSALAPLAAPLGHALESTHPGLRLHITEAEPELAVRLLLQRRVDVALVYRYTNLADPAPLGVESHELHVDPLVAVVRRDHPAVAAEGSPVELRDLAGAPWITAPAETACGAAVLQACRSAGFTPQIRHICSDFTAMIALAASGGHPVVLPRMAAAHLPPSLVARPVADPALARTIEIVVRNGAGHEPAIAACLEVLLTLAPSSTDDGAGIRAVDSPGGAPGPR